MCTVSVIALGEPGSAGSGFRVMCNRDESWERPPALAPRWWLLERGVRGLWPMDTAAGGTWIGASERGLAMAMLNVNLEPPFDASALPGLRSRGKLIPQLIDAADAVGCVERLREMNLEAYAPFRLVAIETGEEGMRLAEARWDRRDFDVAWHGPRPVCFASSGLGDSRVLPRLDLFEDLVVRPGAWPEHQDAFHRHCWEDRREISVLMCREDARTVSITTLDFVRGTLPQMRYEAVDPHAFGGLPPVHSGRMGNTVRDAR